MERLLQMIDVELYKDTIEIDLLIPFEKSEIYSDLKEYANVLTTEYLETGIKIHVEVDQHRYNKYKQYIK